MTVKFVWSSSVSEIMGRLEGIVRKRKLEVARKVFEGVVMRTPVRSGSARASWRASINRPDTSITVNTGGGTLPPPSFPLIDIPLYAKVYIGNSTPYIMELEMGWSRQAPAGMVRVTLASIRILSV